MCKLIGNHFTIYSNQRPETQASDVPYSLKSLQLSTLELHFHELLLILIKIVQLIKRYHSLLRIAISTTYLM